MPTIVVIGNIRIQIFADDHNPPHFHASTPDHEILIRIADLSFLAGQMRGRDLKTVLAWADANRRTLEHEWYRLNAD